MNAALTTTVIIPTFNRASFLVETLESVLAQTLPAAEIIVVDDGSEDDTAERMRPYADRVRYIRKDNSGKADSLNQCIGLANHPLIWIVDDDDIILPHALKTLTGLFSDNPDIGFSYGRYERFVTQSEGGARYRFDCGYWQDVPPEQFLIASLQDMFVHHPGMLVRKSAYENVGPFSAVYTRSEDYDMLIRLAREYTCAGTMDVLFLQRQHDGIRSGGVKADQRDQRWIHEQKIQFEHVYNDSELTDYLLRGRAYKTPLSSIDRREALINRGAIMARKKLWCRAFDDFREACEIDSARPLTEREKMWLRSALFSKYGCQEVLEEQSIRDGLHTLQHMNRIGSQIASTFRRPLLWLAKDAMKHRSLKRSIGFAKLAVSIPQATPVTVDSIATT